MKNTICDLYLMPVVLNLFDGNTNTTLDAGLSDEMKTYYSMRLINLAEPELIHDQFGQKHPIPKNSGKTMFLEHLVPVLRARGLRVAVIKHDGHDFTPDVPGTDSFRMRQAGADGVAVYSGHQWMVVRPQPGSLEALIGQFADCDLVLLEGQKASPYPKIELVRGAVSHESVCAPETLLALATDTPARVDGVETIGLEDYARAAGILLHAMRR